MKKSSILHLALVVTLSACSKESNFKGSIAATKTPTEDSMPSSKTVSGEAGGVDAKTIHEESGNNSTTIGGDSTGGKATTVTDDSSKNPANPSTVEENLAKLPKFGMLVNDFECGFCHMKLVGDMASTATVPPARNDSVATVEGDWLIRGKLNVNAQGALIRVTGKTEENYSGSNVPKVFPVINMDNASKLAKGAVKGKSAEGTAIAIAKNHSGNVSLVGTDADPIVISQDVFINGDLIISGTFTGVGTIYASGSIYIPNDLKAIRSPFPFPADKTAAQAAALATAMAANKDGLGLAAGRSVFIGELDILADARFAQRDPNGLRLDYKEMYKWFTAAKYKALISSKNACGGATSQQATLNLIDAFLYAHNGIHGGVFDSSFSIRGGLAAESFNLLNASRTCGRQGGNSPVHGRPIVDSYIEYDWRLGTGKFPILERLADALAL